MALKELFSSEEYQCLFASYWQSGESLWTEYGGFEKEGQKIRLIGMKKVSGKEEVTDYGELRRDLSEKEWEELRIKLKNWGGEILELEYVEEESRAMKFFKDKGVKEQIEVALRMRLKKTWDEYLMNLKRHSRKELKRKLKKTNELGFKLWIKNEVSEEGLDQFFKLHRLSQGEKGSFMSLPMEGYFRKLFFKKIGKFEPRLWSLERGGEMGAMIIGWEDEQSYYGYNACFNRDYGNQGIGLSLFGSLIQRAIEDKKTSIDWLRGGERYKYELGGEPIGLYKLTIKL